MAREYDRSWKKAQKTFKKCRTRKRKKEIKEKAKAKQGVDSLFLTQILKCHDSFIGCYAENEIDSLTFGNLPCYLIVNIDSSNMPGSHWIALGIFSHSIEIFDPLGFDIFQWTRIPCDLLEFLHRMSITKKIKISKRIQSDSSNMCGFYCLFYLFMRKHLSMKNLLAYFNSNLTVNDTILNNFFM